MHKSHVTVEQLKWSRIAVNGQQQPHPHSFVRNGDEKRLASVTLDATGLEGKKEIHATVSAGLKDLLVLKSSGSSFENYVVDKFTTLKRACR